MLYQLSYALESLFDHVGYTPEPLFKKPGPRGFWSSKAITPDPTALVVRRR
jgi:hypothetical protein